ncbi:MAG: flagellar filament capping protein FliD [Bryobacteraceae bacterium]
MSSLVTPVTFNGQSKFSSDFQNIINRAVQLQSLQLNQLQTQQTDDQNQLAAVQSLDQTFASLQNAISGLTTAIGSGSYSGSVADGSIASVAVGSNATSGVYSLEVMSLGSTTQTVSASGLQTVTDPSSQSISSASSFQLTVGSTSTTITPSGNTLQDLVNSINQNSSLGVSASVVNVGSPGSPNYRLAVQSTSLGNVAIQLNDGSNSLLNTISTGSPATYKVDNLPDTISSSSSTITLAPGVTVSFLGTSTPGVPTTVTVQQTTTATQNALQQLATTYNAVVDQLAAQHGASAGALAGNSILETARSVLQGINSYTVNSGGVQTLGDIGLDLDTSGHLTFNESEFAAGGGANVNALSQFLGNGTSGFLGSVTSALSSLEDPASGILKAQETTLNSDITNIGSQITDQVNAINLYQQNLATQLSQSDATIATLSNQVTYFQDLFFPNANAPATG